MQISVLYWLADYPAPSDFINPLLSCGSFKPANPANQNYSQFCDPAIDRQIAAALAAEATDPQAAAQRWARIDREIVDRAPWVPLFNGRIANFVSKRVGNFEFNPQWGMLIDQLWAR